MIVGRLALAALISFGLAAPCVASDLGVSTFPLGMSLDDFRSKTVIPKSPNHETRILCSFEPEMQTHMVGILGYQLKTSQKAGVVVCIFAEPDRETGLKSGWWEETRVRYGGAEMKWRFWFTGSRTKPGQWELFALAAYGTEATANNAEAVAAMRSHLTREIGAGTEFSDKRYKGLIWNTGSGRATFLVHLGKDVLDDSVICFSVADPPIVAAINKRLAPSSMRVTSLCSPDPS